MRYVVVACVGYLLFSGSACLAQTSDADAAYRYRMQEIEEMNRHAQEVDRAIAQQEAAQARAEAEWRREMREQERLRIEAEQLREMQRQGWELQGLRGDVRQQERALEQMQQDMELRELMR